MAFLYKCDNCGKETGASDHIIITVRSGGSYTVGQLNLDFCSECFGLKVDGLDINDDTNVEELKTRAFSILRKMFEDSSSSKVS
jgi:hypothetical protein